MFARSRLSISVLATSGLLGLALLCSPAAASADATVAESPSGQPMPVGDLPNWHQIVTEDFTKKAPTGSWGSSCDDHVVGTPAGEPAAKDIVYTGATGTRWRTYPDCFDDTAGRPYRSDKVLSVHDGVLDFDLHNVAGEPAGANPSPLLRNPTADRPGTVYQTYGRYSYRFRVDTDTLSEYKVAWLLYVNDDKFDGNCGESDYPEARLSERDVSAFAHYGCKTDHQDEFDVKADLTKWHTFTQEWMPGVRKYFLDGDLIGTSTHNVYDGPERFQMQTETEGNGNHEGHLLVDWVVIYAPKS